jgi:hypothetical protein
MSDTEAHDGNETRVQASGWGNAAVSSPWTLTWMRIVILLGGIKVRGGFFPSPEVECLADTPWRREVQVLGQRIFLEPAQIQDLVGMAGLCGRRTFPNRPAKKGNEVYLV